jgi:hypothetical protein
MTILTIDLPDTLAEEAKQAGLLTPNAIEAILRETLRGRAVNGLFIAADKLAAANLPAMTMGEIQEEVNAVRAQRKQRASGT